jgi:D-alanyl-D-alanine carboxypeptidase/D-alanyl-D-alanine-endopeptidase
MATGYASATAAVPASGITFPRSHRANIGVIVRDLSTGENIVEQNPDKFLTPASIVKSITAASVLLAGKADTAFSTPVYALGDIDADGMLNGSIVIKASGDPTTESPRFSNRPGLINSTADCIRRLGIRGIRGSLEIDSAGFVQQGPVDRWEFDDLKYAYGAGLHPVNYHDNTINGDRALADPAEELLITLEERMDADSINVEWNEVDTAGMLPRPLLTAVSQDAWQIMREMMEQSVNLYAESMLRLLAPGENRDAALARQLQLLQNLGIDTEAAQLFDGSGLTRANRVTPDFMADLLETMAKSEFRERFVSLFPCVGQQGTVRRLLCNTPLEGRLVLKSGSMNGVQSYAGYRLDSSNRPTHVVVIIVNDFTCKRAAVTSAISSFLLRQFPE